MQFGVNVDPLNFSTMDEPVSLLVRTTATWTRTVLKLDQESRLKEYFTGCMANGIKELGVIARESADFSEHPSEQEFTDKVGLIIEMYRDYVDIIQTGNQPDNPADDSWTQPEEETTMMVRVVDLLTADIVRRSGPALVTGQPYKYDINYVDYEAANIYATAKNYNGTLTNRMLLITEYPANIPSLGVKIAQLDQAQIAFVFGLSDRMVRGLGLYTVNGKPKDNLYKFKKLVKDYS